MKKILVILFLLAHFLLSADDIRPVGGQFKLLPTYSFSLNNNDSIPWMYGGKGRWFNLDTKSPWYAKMIVNTDTIIVPVHKKDTLDITIFKLSKDSIIASGYITNWRFKHKLDSVMALYYKKTQVDSLLNFKRNLTNHDSLSHLDERKYQSLTDTLTWGLGLSQSGHIVKVDTTSASILSRQRAVNTYIPLIQKGANNGVATLDAGGKVPLTQMNDGLLGAVRYQALYNATTNTPALPLASVSKGYYYIIDVGGTVGGIVYNPGDWIISSGLGWGKVDNNNAISSVFGRVGNITATSGDYTADQITETASRVFVSPTEKSNFNTAYGWGNHASAGYGLASALTTHAGLTTTAHGLGASAFHADSYFQTALTNPVTGTGTTNYIPKFTGLGTIGNSPFSTDTDDALILPNKSGSRGFIIVNEGATYTGILGIQAGYGSAGAGGAINLYGASNSTHSGDVAVGISQTSGAKFRVNSSALDQGNDLLSIDRDGYSIFSGTVTAPKYHSTGDISLDIGNKLILRDSDPTASYLTYTLAGGQRTYFVNSYGLEIAGGVTSVTNNTQSTSYTTGALVLGGGIGVNGNGYFNGTGTFIGNLTAPSINLTTGATLNYFWKCTNSTTGAGAWAAVSESQFYNGAWSAATNTPTLADGTGTRGTYYHCTASGTVDFDGAGGRDPIAFTQYIDDVAYNGTIWEKIPNAQYSLLTMSSSVIGGAKLGSGMNVGGEGTDILNILNEDKGDITVSGSGNQYGRAWSIDAQNSAFWAGKITDATGSGNVVFSTSPTLVTPVLGTPTSGNLANCTFPTLNQNTTGTAAGLTAQYIDWNSASGGNSIANKPTIPTVNNATLTLNTSGSGISGSQTFTANQSTGATFTVTSNATTSNTAGTIVLRDGSGNVSLTGSFCSSDTTLKRSIKPFSKVDLYNASKIDFIKFLFKDDKTNWQHYGVAYQQVKELLPSVTKVNEETGKGEVNYTEMLILIVAQQKESIEKLTKRLDELEKNPFGKMRTQEIYCNPESGIITDTELIELTKIKHEN